MVVASLDIHALISRTRAVTGERAGHCPSMDGLILMLLALGLVVPVFAAVAGLVAVLFAVGMALLIVGPSALARWVSGDEAG